jgi:hypothetical protein
LRASTLADHVVRVVLLGTEEEVSGVVARWVVAVVKDETPIRHRSVHEFVDPPMHTYLTTVDASDAVVELARSLLTRPFPAFVG